MKTLISIEEIGNHSLRFGYDNNQQEQINITPKYLKTWLIKQT